MKITTSSFTRPANTTQYAAGDVMGELLEFGVDANVAELTSAMLIDTAAETVKPEADLFLFSAAPTVAADNAAFAPTDAQMKELCTVVPFLATNFVTGNGNGLIMAAIDFVQGRAVTGQKLYGVLVARNTYTPVSEEGFTVRLGYAA